MKFTQELPVACIVNPSSQMEMRMQSTWTHRSAGISASMADVVTLEVANELTFRFTSAYLSVIIAFSSHKSQCKGAGLSSPSSRNRNNGETRRHTMDT